MTKNKRLLASPLITARDVPILPRAIPSLRTAGEDLGITLSHILQLNSAFRRSSSFFRVPLSFDNVVDKTTLRQGSSFLLNSVLDFRRVF